MVTREITMQRASAVKKSTGEIKTGGFYEVSISVRNNCPLGPSHEEDMYFGRLMVICGLCYCKLECLCCSMFLQDGPQKFWLQHTYLTFTFRSIVPYFYGILNRYINTNCKMFFAKIHCVANV